MLKGTQHKPETIAKLRDLRLGQPGHAHKKGVPISKNATVVCVGCGLTIENTTANRRWCADCKKIAKNESLKQYKKNHAAKVSEDGKRYYADVVSKDEEAKSRRREYFKEYYCRTQMERLDCARQYRLNHPEAKIKKREYEKAHPEFKRISENRRRSRKYEADGSHTKDEFFALCETLDWKCTYCGESLSKKTVSEDHKIPLSKGGSDYITNITPSCRICNSRKSTKTDNEYFRLLYTERINHANSSFSI